MTRRAGAGLAHPEARMLKEQTGRTGEVGRTGRRAPQGPPRALATELSIIEQHLQTIEGYIARLESGLAALGRGVAPADEPGFPDRLEAGELAIEHGARKTYINDVEVPLSPTEYRCLHALVRSGGRVVAHQDLLRWATGSALSEPSHLKVYVARLRAKLRGAGASDGLVESVRGIGYRLATRRDADGRACWAGGGRLAPKTRRRDDAA